MGKLLLSIGHRFAVFPQVPPVFVVGVALRFSQLWSSEGGMLSLKPEKPEARTRSLLAYHDP